MIYDQTNLILEDIHDEALEQLLEEHSTKLFVPEKQMFAVPGDRLEGLLYIKKGRTRHYMMNNEGTEKLLYVLTCGWFFGEICCWMDIASGVYSEAERDTQFLVIQPDTVKQFMCQNETFRNMFIRCLAQKTLVLRNEIETLVFLSGKERMKRLLSAAVDKQELYEGKWYGLKIEYTHTALGSIIGASRVTISRAIRELRNEDFMRTVNNKIQISASECLKLDNPYLAKSVRESHDKTVL